MKAKIILINRSETFKNVKECPENVLQSHCLVQLVWLKLAGSAFWTNTPPPQRNGRWRARGRGLIAFSNEWAHWCAVTFGCEAYFRVVLHRPDVKTHLGYFAWHPTCLEIANIPTNTVKNLSQFCGVAHTTLVYGFFQFSPPPPLLPRPPRTPSLKSPSRKAEERYAR